ncbi:MAG: hypothetical protein NT058_01175, partial [Candidatus Portnoybacteria bacterium]|nr:hypothetical protein [Candidatus Portnoybacteria bacterium]
MDSKNLNLYFREIAHQDPKSRKDSICGVFSYEATNVEDIQLGNLYIVGKISNIPKKQYRNSDFLLGLLVSVIKREFYSNYQRTTLEALESALQSANIYLADFSKKGHTAWIGNLHLACLVFSRDDIHVGQTGKMIVQLFRSGTVSNISKKFEVTEELDPNKTFSNIASGKIEKEDKILIATYDLLNVLSTQKIKGLIVRHTTDKLYHYIKDNLPKDSLACLMLDAETQAPKEDEVSTTVKIPTETDKKSAEIGLVLKDFFDLKANQVNKIIKNQITIPNKITAFFLDHHIIKYILVLFLGLVIAVSPYLVIKLNYDLKIRKLDGLIQRITEDIEKSKLSLTYQNQSEAREFLKQANILMNSANSMFAELSKSAQYKISE